MPMVLIKYNKMAGSIHSNDPRLIGAIIEEMLRSNSPLAKGYRKFLASKENIAEKGDNKHE